MDGQPVIDKFQKSLEKIVDDFRDQGLTIGEAIGSIEILKMGLYLEGDERDEF